MFLALVMFVFLLICVYKETPFKRPFKSLLGFHGNKRLKTSLCFVIIHDNELQDGGFLLIKFDFEEKVGLGYRTTLKNQTSWRRLKMKF